MTLSLLLAGCNRAAHSKEAVKRGIVEHLAKGSGLDLSLMDMEVTSVSFTGDQARATVWFKPKSDPTMGMQMNYNLQAKGSQWVVSGKPDGAVTHGAGAAPESPLPPGHPAVPEPRR